MKNLAYHMFNYLMPLYLEYAPLSISRDKTAKKKVEVVEEEEEAVVVEELDPQKKQERTVFVKNLNAGCMKSWDSR